MPPHQRETQRLFWIEITNGSIPAQAAIAVGGRQVGQRWFHNAGSTPPFDLEPLSGRYLLFPEREEIALRTAHGAWSLRDRSRYRSSSIDDLVGGATHQFLPVKSESIVAIRWIAASRPYALARPDRDNANAAR